MSCCKKDNIDWDKPLRVRVGHHKVVLVRELHNPEGNPHRLCYVTDPATGKQSPLLLNEYGSGVCECSCDVENAVDTIETWLNVHRNCDGIYFGDYNHSTEWAARADCIDVANLVTTMKITYTVGDK